MRNLAKAAKEQFENESLNRKLAGSYRENLRILVVDDEKEITASYQDILIPREGSLESNVVPIRSSRSKMNRSDSEAAESNSEPSHRFQVDVAYSYKEALDLVKVAVADGCPYALGFFDVMLGEGPDGYDLVKQIHEMDDKMYAVFVTAFNDRSIDSIQAFLGEDKTQRWDYLNKPFSHGEILQKARNFVRLYNLSEEKALRDRQIEQVRRTLVESEKLSSVAAVARGVSHEFGNLLMQIMGKADLCITSGREEKMKEGLQVILDATTRANDILEKFKDLSNPHGDSNQMEPVVVSEVLDEALSLMEHKIRTSELKVSKIKSDKVTISANRTSLLQVFVNLTINALHAMGDSGQIDYTIADLGDEVEIRVRDYGPGIKPEDLENVLQPFFTTKGGGGTGLGLPICQEIIEVDHRGRFSVQNHGVKGLEVVIGLPKAHEGWL